MDPPPSHVPSQVQYVSHGHQDVSLLPPRAEKDLEFDLPSLRKLIFFFNSEVFEISGAKLSRTGKGRQRDLGQIDNAAPKGVFPKTRNLHV